ncbi:MAG: hypothetical protein JWM11_7237 [Planctomycetaceae bacterium]|nr:hypothetical protein [Planctomycetaceae bacterium]
MLFRPYADFLRRLRDSFCRKKRTFSQFSGCEQLEDRLLLSINPVQVADIFPGPKDSAPQQFTNLNGTLYFTATDGVHGVELWKSDGTTAGTVQVKDINPGAGNSNPGSLTVVNSSLYFTANDGTSGVELWKSDGTAAGTTLVKDIAAGSISSGPTYLTNVNGTLYFQADDSTTGAELWKSDGTSAGTVMVKEINVGSTGSNPSYITNVNGTLYFAASDDATGEELWKSNGTAAGTVLVKDIFSGTDSYGNANNSNPVNLTNVNGTLYFTAANSASQSELWKSDGTSSGTVLVKDLDAATGSYSPSSLTNVNGTLFFGALDSNGGGEFWKSNGSASGTVRLKDFGGGSYYAVTYLTNVNGTVYFEAGDHAGSEELWKSDGTSGGTDMVKNLYPGAVASYLSDLTNVNGTLYFTADDGVHGPELWKSNGAAAGTVMVKDLVSGSNGSYPSYLINLNGTLFFEASTAAAGDELWHLADSNLAPTDISLSTTSIAENNAANAAIGTLSATDANAGDTFTYSLVTGTGSTDNASFSISGNTLKIVPSANFEAQSSYSILVQVADQGGLKFQKQFTINVTDVNEAPTSLALSATSILEQNVANATVGTLTAVDPDTGNTLTFSLAPGTGSTDNSSFSIVGNSLQIIPVTSFATKNNYAIRVRVTDQGGLSFDKQFTINVTKTNTAPTDISLSSTSVVQHNVANATVGTLSAIDVDTGNTFTFTLVSGIGSTDNSSFSITGNTLKIVPVTDLATQSSYAIRVRVTDQGGLSFEKQFTIGVVSAPQFPAAITLNTQPLAYHVAARKVVAFDGSATLVANNGAALALTGATLKVSGQTAKDTLSIQKLNGLTTKGKNVLSGKTVIATFAGGKKGAALTITFTSAATQTLVQKVLDDIGFKSVDKVTGTRQIQMQIKAGSTSITNLATRQIDVGH